MASYNQPGSNSDNLNTLLAHLQSGRSTSSDDPNSRDLLSRFAANNQASQSHGPYYTSSGESPAMGGSDGFPPPAAPTPPMSNFPHSHVPPAIAAMSLGPIGTLPSSAGSSQPEQTTNLLNLLKFNGPSSSHSSAHSHRNSNPTAAPGPPSFDGSISLPHSNIPPTLHAPVPMPADPQGFLASLMKGGGDAQHEHSRSDAQPPAPASHWNPAPGPADDTQQYLLNLLNRKKPSQTDQPSTNESSQPAALTPQSTAQGSVGEPPRDFQLKADSTGRSSKGNTPLPYASFLPQQQQHAPSPPVKDYGSPSQNGMGMGRKTMFDYKDPFDDLIDAPSPHNRTPKSVASGSIAPGAVAPSFQILKKPASGKSSPAGSEQKPIGSRRSSAMSPEYAAPAAFDASRSRYAESAEPRKEPVAQAVEDIAEMVDVEAREAVARAEAEESQARIARELEDMLAAKSEAELDEKTEIVARDLQQELHKEENVGVLEQSLPADVARVVHEIVDEAANGQAAVADSWESAEADTIVVIEEVSTPIKVFNFPMKPWISIALQDTDAPRPQFRDDVILDIARVKKEFDQIDRNLVSATETYIIYGMSKAGGLRVIRQDDGRDAKLFTDTKDRIFNVTVCSSPSDLNIPQKETIIGTGISGTVYYAQVKNGDKEYLDDAHPEQYGFALPPISTQEGDAPGGVLKTRARTSSTHPEYFAVGRGKTINLVWPSYVMQNKLIKPGHDRVVDTEKLSKQCSLRINTGKAGKDFTFSQDDTTIVSLDKSGRVKFWDIRDLTAADENSDPRSPMPAHTSLEVKEPLMTLTTTPEGEKAWPTSVLLLDKQRPYQKRCALRYMIVGMKQNHTLQLWDLALGKPVQEFNLPHSKESDAVCSVMYHPPTGMIVVGHPTRNSIYFLHLSAPKYTIKGLSQVDYIQKLVAKDSSIPEPDSTAVISGVREYSFSNKGILRSLDILVNPTASSDDDEPILFELYAMHSKGVSGICVKQSGLGWTKDNKVVTPVDAVETGIVKITKLRELPGVQPAEIQATEDATSLPIRTGRPSVREKENGQATSGDDAARKPSDENTPSAERNANDGQTAPLEKGDRRSRKKKEKAAAAAAAAAEKNALSADNGGSQSPHIGPSAGKNEPKASSAFSQSVLSSDSLQAAVKQVESTVSVAVEQALRENRQKADNELRSRDAAFKKSQQNLLDVVSSALDTNVQKVLTATIQQQVEQTVVPALETVLRQTVTDQLGRVVSEQLDSKISGRVSHAIQNQMQKLLPNAVGQALLKPELTKAVSAKLTDGLTAEVQKTFVETLHDQVTPTFTNIAVAAATKMVEDVHHQAASQIGDLERKINADSNKIEQLTALVVRLSETVSNMAKHQADFQSRFTAKMQDEATLHRHSRSQSHTSRQHDQFPQHTTQSFTTQASSRHQSYASPSAHSGNQLMAYPPNDPRTSKDQDLQRKIAEVAAQVENGEFEGALVRWLQSDRKEEIFGDFLAKLDVQMLRGLSSLVGLAVIAELSRNLDGHLREKVVWMNAIVRGLHDTLPNVVSSPQPRLGCLVY